MSHSFPGTFLLAIVLASASCCQGCRENTSEASKPVGRPTSAATPREESFTEASPKQNAGNDVEAESTDEVSAANEGIAEQESNSGSTGSSDRGNQSTGSSGQRPGLGKPAAPASAANKPSSSNTRSVQPTFSLPRFDSAEAALTYAKRQREKSSKLSDSGDTATAYEEALRGWQALQPHLADNGCGKLSEDLLADLEASGEKLGSKDISIIGKPLKIK